MEFKKGRIFIIFNRPFGSTEDVETLKDFAAII